MRTTITLTVLMLTSLLSAQKPGVISTTTKEDDKTFMISVSVGPSYRVAKATRGLTPAEERYFRELRFGFAYDVSAYIVQDESVGYGLRYNSFSSNGSSSNPNIVDPGGEEGPGIEKDEIRISFYGFGALLQDRGLSPNDKISLEVALGYIHYVNNARFLYNYKLTGGNLGVSTTMAYQFAISKGISIGPSLSFTGGVMKKIHIKGNGEDKTSQFPGDELESLYRFDLSATARFQF